MVCISCFIAPVVLFIWYKFIYPYLQPLINRFIGNYQLPQPFQNLACPMPKKNKDGKQQQQQQQQQEGDKDSGDSGDSDLKQTPEMKCPFAAAGGPSPHNKKDD